MKKVWNSLRYGNAKTRMFLVLVIVLTIASLGSIVTGIALSQFTLGVTGFILSLVTLIVSQSVNLEKLQIEKTDKKREKKKGEKSKKIKENIEEPQQNKLPHAFFAEVTQKNMKQMMYKYKVSKEHKLVMVDKCDSCKKKQCPAFIWKNKGVFHVLLIGDEPKEIVFATSELKEIHYVKNVTVHANEDYIFLQNDSLITKLFGEFAPTYRDKQVGDKLVYTKNLYALKEDVYFTNKSAKNLFEVLNLKFVVDDTVTRTDRYEEYFKEMYRKSILYHDGVYTMEEYKVEAEMLLVRMSQAGNVPQNTFKRTVGDMLRYRLITRDMLSVIEDKL